MERLVGIPTFNDIMEAIDEKAVNMQTSTQHDADSMESS